MEAIELSSALKIFYNLIKVESKSGRATPSFSRYDEGENKAAMSNHVLKRPSDQKPDNSKLVKRSGNEVLRSFFNSFLDLNDITKLRNDINLNKFSRDSGWTITDKSLVELLNIHNSFTTLNLTNCSEVTDHGLIQLAKGTHSLSALLLNNLTKISASGVRSICLSNLNLTTLELSNAEVTDECLKAISSSSDTLTTLKLDKNKRITDVGLSSLIYCLKKLRTLSISSCTNIGKYGNILLTNISNSCEFIEYLNISYCQEIKSFGVSVLLFSKPNERNKLKYLKANGCTGLEIKAFKPNFAYNHFSCNSVLQVLEIGGLPKLSEGDLREFASLQGIKYLAITHNLCVSTQGLRFLFSGCKCLNWKLVDLNLGSCVSVSDESLFEISRSLTALQKLNLMNNMNITFKGLQYLFESIVHLTQVNLINCKFISYNELKAFTAKLPFSKIKPLPRGQLETQQDDESLNKFCVIAARKSAKKMIKEYLLSLMEMKASLKIQSFLRNLQVRGGLRKIKEEKVKLLYTIKIQKSFRQYHARQARKKQDLKLLQSKNIVTMQRLFRGFLGRKEYRYRARQLVYQNKCENAASLIVKSVKTLRFKWMIEKRINERKALEREKVRARKKMRERVILIQCCVRVYMSRLKLKSLFVKQKQRVNREVGIAVKAVLIQSTYRMFITRKEYLLERERLKAISLRLRRITRVQGLFRRKKAYRQLLYLMKEERIRVKYVAALQVQRIWRGFKGKQITSLLKGLQLLKIKEDESSTIIQKLSRRVMASKVLQSKRRAKEEQEALECLVKLVQRRFRIYIHSKEEVKRAARDKLVKASQEKRFAEIKQKRLALETKDLIRSVQASRDELQERKALLEHEKILALNKLKRGKGGPANKYFDSCLLTGGVMQRYPIEQYLLALSVEERTADEELISLEKQMKHMRQELSRHERTSYLT